MKKKTSFVRKQKRGKAQSTANEPDTTTTTTSTSASDKQVRFGIAQPDNKIVKGQNTADIGKAVGPPTGSRRSVKHGQLICSSGLKDFDVLVGEGLEMGSITMVEEDINYQYYNNLLQYFVVQGLYSNQLVLYAFFSTTGSGKQEVLSKLPKVYGAAHSTQANGAGDDGDQNKAIDDIKIAWRYKNMPTQQPSRDSEFRRNFDLSQAAQLSQSQRHLFFPFDLHHLATQSRADGGDGDDDDGLFHPSTSTAQNCYKSLYDSILHKVQVHASKDKVLRIVIRSLGSPLYNSSEQQMLKFLHKLRGLLRSAPNVVCCFSFPAHIYQSSFVIKVRHLVDIAVGIQSFKGEREEEVAPAYQQYSGMVHLYKLPVLRTLKPHKPETNLFVFTKKKRKMEIEVFHLPPEISRTGDQGATLPVKQQLTACQPNPTKPNHLDF